MRASLFFITLAGASALNVQRHKDAPLTLDNKQEAAAAMWAMVKADDVREEKRQRECEDEVRETKRACTEMEKSHLDPTNFGLNKMADATQLRLAADVDEREAVQEELEAQKAKEDAIAIEKASQITKDIEESRAKKAAKSKKELDTAIAAAEKKHKKESLDARDIKARATSEENNAKVMEKDATRLRQDAAAVVAVADTETKIADAKQMLAVADIEETDARKEFAEVREDRDDAAAIKRAAAIIHKKAKAREAAAQREEKDENADAKRIESIASKEEQDAKKTELDVTHLRQGAMAIASEFVHGASSIAATISSWMR